MPRISIGSKYGLCRVDKSYQPVDWLKGISIDGTPSITLMETSAKQWKTRSGATSFLNKNIEILSKFVVLPIT
jgi:hypothetical protein